MRLDYDKIREIARINFVNSIRNYDHSDFSSKLDSGRIEGSLTEGYQDGLVRYGIYETRATDGDEVREYGVVTIDPYSGECLNVEIKNMKLRIR